MSKRKQIPTFKTEAEERAFWETYHSAKYMDWHQAKKVTMPYQSLIKAWLSNDVKQSRSAS